MSKPKILLTRRWPAEVQNYLASRYEVTLNDRDVLPGPEELRAALRSHDAVCPTVTDRLTADILQAGAGKVRIIGNYGVGVSHIDVDACKRLGIVVTNTPDVLTEPTAEIALTLILMVARGAGAGEREIRNKTWAGWGPMRNLGALVTGRTLGLIGFGRIGQATARMAHHGFGMRVIYFSRRRAAADIEAQTGATQCASLDELLAASDFISLHCPGGAANRHLIDARRLQQMKKTAFLINTARGEVVDEEALAQALRSGTIAGAGLDVYEQEPRVPPELLTLENVVLLPHLGSATLETRTAMGMRVAKNLDSFFSGAAPPDRVA
ncbi:MAG TPA: D-glycerate dehydrogenase [Steroidobacteraceae bacterium]|nr:D-glycerate dehydrogenase [Steroidobacteraceae bacterium]